MSDKTTAPTYFVMRLCGDCPSGPPCRCAAENLTSVVVGDEWISGKWVRAAHCKQKAMQNV